MADNTTLNAGADGDLMVTREISHAGDTAKLGGTFLVGISGDEGSYTWAAINGDATNGLDVDVTRSALPTGAATAANQTTIIGHVDGLEALLTTIDADTSSIASDLATIAGAVSGSEVQVDIVSSALPTGAATSANQTTIIGHLDGVEGLLTTIDADTGSMAANLTTLAGAVSGTEMQVDVLTLPTLANVTTVATVSALTGGGVAHDSADSGNPHKIGGKATTSQSGLTLVANADRTDAMFAADGSQLVRNVCLEDVVQERTTNTDGNSTAFASGLAAPGSGVRLWITNVDICNSSATDISVDLRDGSGGSVLWTLPVPAGGGVVKQFNPPLKLTANTALAFDGSAAASTITISANGFKSKI